MPTGILLFSFSYGIMSLMSETTETDLEEKQISELEERLKEQFEKTKFKAGPSTAVPNRTSARVDQLVLKDGERGNMPFTKEQFIIRENPHLVAWERETRKFLRNLSPNHGHRVSAVMIYEWATGISVKELQEEGGSANGHLRHLNKLLAHYFGDSFATWIMGKKVARAYRIKPGVYITRRRPLTLELYAEYREGTLYP